MCNLQAKRIKVHCSDIMEKSKLTSSQAILKGIGGCITSNKEIKQEMPRERAHLGHNTGVVTSKSLFIITNDEKYSNKVKT